MAAAASPLPHPFVRPPRPGAVPLVSPVALASLRKGSEPVVVLDVRPASERAYAHLPEDLHIPLSELPARVRELPTDRPIVVYDQLGNHARRAVEFLQAAGFGQAAALEGGLDEYARLVDPDVGRYPTEPGGGHLVLHQIPRPETGCLAYLIADTQEREAIVVDPGHDAHPYLARLATDGWELAAIVETHTHADHLAGHAELSHRTDAPIYLSPRSPAQYPHRSFGAGESIRFGNEELLAAETPGHTRDHLTLTWRGRAFTGDTLLIGGCGRTDLGDGNPELLWESLTEKLLKLPAETEVFPAHYGPRHALVDRYSSTIGFERATNEALRQGSRAAFLTYMTEGWPPKPVDFDRIVAANLAPFP